MLDLEKGNARHTFEPAYSLIDLLGAKAIAKACGIGPSTVYMWNTPRHRGRVPKAHYVTISTLAASRGITGINEEFLDADNVNLSFYMRTKMLGLDISALCDADFPIQIIQILGAACHVLAYPKHAAEKEALLTEIQILQAEIKRAKSK